VPVGVGAVLLDGRLQRPLRQLKVVWWTAAAASAKRLPCEAPPGGGSTAAAAAAAAARSAAESGGPLSAAHGIARMNRSGPRGYHSVRQCGLHEAGGSFDAQHVARVRVCVDSGDGPRRGTARTRFV